MKYIRPADKVKVRKCIEFLREKGYMVSPAENDYSFWNIMVVTAKGSPWFFEFTSRDRFHETFIKDVDKVQKLISKARAAQGRAGVIVEVDGKYYVWYAHAALPERMFQRNKPRGIKGETKDPLVPVYDIPISEFKPIGEAT